PLGGLRPRRALDEPPVSTVALGPREAPYLLDATRAAARAGIRHATRDRMTSSRGWASLRPTPSAWPILATLTLAVAVGAWLRWGTTATVRATWVALLAISPLLVYQSKTARPYALTSLFAFIAIVAFRKWWQKDGPQWTPAVAYVIATFLAGWLHPITLPFTL